MSDFQIINAPAGSGKSTEIKRIVRQWSADHPLDRLLCVTYTNRAAGELKAEISSPYIEVSTIHSFFSRFAQSIFSAPEIVDHYFEIYGDAVKKRIENASKSSTTEESNARYREKLGDPLTFELIRASVNSLYYNERPFNTLYRGGLSHDDLLSFVASCARRFPNIYRRVSAKYRRVIIDEYQDTDVNVLEFFLDAIRGSNTDLHLYGDRMQQIYKTDPSRFQVLIQAFSAQKRDVINFRSTGAIVSVLNAIYNDANVQQVADSEVDGLAPRIHFSENINDTVDQTASADTLILSVHNSSIYGAVGSLELFNALKKLPDHGYNSRYPAAAALIEPNWEEVPNPLLRLLYGLLNLESEHSCGHIGTVISTLRAHPTDFGDFTLRSHEDKALLGAQLASLFEVMNNSRLLIKDVLEALSNLTVNRAADVSDYLSNESYDALVLIPFQQVRNVFEFRSSPTRSTQHGVKGESHEKVLFVAESSASPAVHMKSLLDLWPKFELNLDVLERLLGDLSKAFRLAEDAIGADVSKLNRETFPAFEDVITGRAQSVVEQLRESDLFESLYGAAYAAYLKKPGVTKAKNLFKLSPIEGLLAAYRLFYVGCSRAKSELDIVIPIEDIRDRKATSDKLASLGFQITVNTAT